MIIQRIKAQNVLKYATLAIEAAEQGLIAISGHNESGKSSIGEAVCFALFGRTFSITPEHVEKVIRWGENHCNVTLDFAVEGTSYTVSRFLDRDGNHSAKLALADDPENPIARGVRGVSEALFGILGYAFAEFIESFYLAQREITTPHPHSHAVKIMAGVAPMEQVADGLEEEIAERRELLGEIQAEWEAVDLDVQGLGIQQGLLPKLEDEHYRTAQEAERVAELTEQVRAGTETCIANNSKIHRIQSANGRTGLLRFLFLLLALGVAGVWALLTYGAQLPEAEQARAMLSRFIPQWSDDKVAWIGYLAAALAAIFLLLWVRAAGQRRQIAALRSECGGLRDAIEAARRIEIEALPVDEAIESAASDEEADDEQATSLAGAAPLRPEAAEYEALLNALDRNEASSRLITDYCEREITWLNFVSQQFDSQLAEMDREIEDEHSRLQEAMDLSDILNGLTDKREEVEERVADRKRALELLSGAMAELASHFNRDIKELAGRMLPLFTDGRYEHLQIDQGLTVRVFSSEKRDFLDLDEVSSGTQRQIMLALRLALSKKLLSRTVKGKQFAFLDEPFAFFDEERTRHALRALADLGDDISQVWIVAQDFPHDGEVRFDTTIDCERGNDSLSVGLM